MKLEATAQLTGWTLFVRLTHWLVATCVLFNFFNDTGFWHRTVGYACLAFVVLRIIYGLMMSKVASSRFHLPRVQHIKQHLRELWSGSVSRSEGHNPLGQYAVYLMWLLIGLLALTGWLSRTDAYWGEDWPVDLHGVISKLLQGLVLIHIAAVLLMSKLEKRNLIIRMVRR